MNVVRRLDGLYTLVREGFGDKIVALRREIHREPEIGFDTKRTAAKVVESLVGLPLVIQTGVAQNGVLALLRGAKEGPTVALRADMDTLPIHEETGCRLPLMVRPVAGLTTPEPIHRPAIPHQ